MLALALYPYALGEGSMNAPADTPQGTLELLILKTLAHGPNHGFGVVLHIQEASSGLLRVEEGSVYPALHRMEKDGLLAGDWKTTDSGRRARVYRLTAAGHQRLTTVEARWATLSAGVSNVLRFA